VVPLEKVLIIIIFERSRSQWPQARMVLDRLNIGVVNSNPTRGTDVCMSVSVLCCPAWVGALRWADPPSKKSYQNVYMDSKFRNSFLNRDSPGGVIREQYNTGRVQSDEHQHFPNAFFANPQPLLQS
jgi:hypothetical protein